MSAPPVTVMTGEELQSFVDEAKVLLEGFKAVRARPLALGLLGVSLIHTAAKATSGDLGWWAQLVCTGTIPRVPIQTDGETV